MEKLDCFAVGFHFSEFQDNLLICYLVWRNIAGKFEPRKTRRAVMGIQI